MKKMLIVDDDNVIADLYAVKFRSAGYEVVTVYSAAEMNAQFASGFVPDVMLLDVIMPKMNGVEVVRMMTHKESLKNVKIILFSNLDYRNKLEPDVSARISGFCIKSEMIPSQVLKMVEEILKK